MEGQSCLILHNIRSAYNVGAIFRTADAAGISKIYLCGYTPAPIDRFKRENSGIAKTALGAEKHIAWEVCLSASRLIGKLQRSGIQVIALEQDKSAVDYKSIKPEMPWALLLGEEVHGINKTLLAKCDAIIEIPMRGKKESLNVSVAAGIAIYWLQGI